MTIQTRKPTGKPSWPITLLAGAEKAGKSYSAAEAASSDLIARTYWVGIGEDAPDEYGLLADFDIVEHDGTYRDILRNLTEIAAEQPAEGEVVLLVVDSMTRLWDLIKDNAQASANNRAAANAKKYGKTAPTGDVPISMDLWNVAKSQWGHIMDAIRAHRGPVILTARLDSVTIMDDEGKPTKAKQDKVNAEKSLPYDVGAVIEMPARGETYISGVRSVRMKLAAKIRVENFTVDTLWRNLGLDRDETSERVHDAPKVEAAPVEESGRDWLAEAELLTSWVDLNRLVAAALASKVDEETVAAIRLRRDEQPKPETSAA